MKKISLNDKYLAESGRVYLNGCQALTRLPMMQHQRDRAAGLNTAGFISGYRGSPLGVYDLALWQAQPFLEQNQIHFEPGINEDMAATACWGSQQVKVLGESDYDGVFALWYGKGPGVDRSGDPLKHANYAGVAEHGGVLALCGDDHGARSSTTAHQSDHALIHFGMPILNPATVQEYLDYGLYGFALSRYAGCWVGFKCVTDTVESSSSVAVDPARIRIALPREDGRPRQGLGIQTAFTPLLAEQLVMQRLDAVRAFVRANRLDRSVLGGAGGRLGIITSGKAYLDVIEALAQLGIDQNAAQRLGIAVYKVALTWPIEPHGIRNFASGCEQLLVIEEKRPVMEEQIAALLYNLPAAQRPVLLGKQDAAGNALVSSVGELSSSEVALLISSQLLRQNPDAALAQAREALQQTLAERAGEDIHHGGLRRVPSFCAGCPHNTSTNVPEGSVALGGIGCHGLAVWMPERNTLGLSHMGGEGATWIGQQPFMKRDHVFQNLGDGTYFHSGLMAIRANVAANRNITYKILLNGAISMTGGQPIEGQSFDGGITAPKIAQQVHAEGVKRIALVTDDLLRHGEQSLFPGITTFHDRDDLDAVQQEIRRHRGVSVLIYEQACATERRRLRKRGAYPDSSRRLFINEAVCEGCGDCGVQSNCIALEPHETAFGRKRKINQSICNQDFSCVKGFCPSFVSVYGGELRGGEQAEQQRLDQLLSAELPQPAQVVSAHSYDILVAGIGGSGIITLGALLGTAAHMDGKPCTVLDITGLSQRNGAVTSHVRFIEGEDLDKSTRIPEAAADLVLAADLVVAAGHEVLSTMAAQRSAVVYNHYVAPTSAFARNADLSFDSEGMEASLKRRTRPEQLHGIPASRIATHLLGHAVGANCLLLGIAWQQGLIPLSCESLEYAIELNGVAVEMNLRAFRLGRVWVASPMQREAMLGDEQAVELVQLDTQSLDGLIEQRVGWLTAYQNADYAGRYRELVQKVRRVELARTGAEGELTEAAARYYAKLLAYKDEYEVARLYTRPEFMQRLKEQFSGDFRLGIHLAPPLLSSRDPHSGRYRKKEFGQGSLRLFGLLARFKFLRGTPLDLFGYSPHRRLERQLIADYETLSEEVLAGLTRENHPLAVQLLNLPEQVRGYDVVKEAHIERADARKAELLVEFRKPAVAAGAAREFA